jgi:hypothetical protein
MITPIIATASMICGCCAMAAQARSRGFAETETVRRLRQRFGYVFAGQDGYPTICTLDTLDRLRMIAGFGVDWCQMAHGPGETTAYRFEADGKSIGYATDFSGISDEMIDLFYGSTFWSAIACAASRIPPMRISAWRSSSGNAARRAAWC